MAWTDEIKLFLSLTPLQLLTLTAYGEAGKEGDAGIVAVMNVIRNRTLDTAHKSQFVDPTILSLTGGSLYHAVILKQKQFSMYNPGDAVRAKADIFASDWNQAINSGNQYLTRCYQLAQQFLAGQIGDNTQGATYYHATYVSPDWKSEKIYIGQIGQHIFYRDTGVSVATGTGTPTVLSVSPSPLFWMVVLGAGGLLLLYLLLGKKGGKAYG